MSMDTQPPVLDAEVPTAAPASQSINKTPPTMFAVLRAGGGGLERFPATSREEAVRTLKKQVANSRTPIVYLYELVGAEVFVPTSETLRVDDISTFLKSDGTWPLPVQDVKDTGAAGAGAS